MTRTTKLAMFTLVLSSLLTGGCQNTIHVRVEKVLGVSSVSRDSRVGRQLDQAIESLTKLIGDCNNMETALDEYIQSLEPARREDITNFSLPWREVLTGRRESARALREECLSLFTAKPEGARLIPREQLHRVAAFSDETQRIIRDWRKVFEKVIGAEGIAETMNAEELGVMAAFTSLELAAQEASKSTRIGFGGFMTTDVFVVNPSDPKYADILKTGSPVGAVFLFPWWQHTSLETITEAHVGVTGDSAIMLVMESPGQVRVYQVSNDPTQVTRNIGLLISKATAAAAKYMTGI